MWWWEDKRTAPAVFVADINEDGVGNGRGGGGRARALQGENSGGGTSVQQMGEAEH